MCLYRRSACLSTLLATDCNSLGTKSLVHKDSPRSVEFVATILANDRKFENITKEDVRKAVSHLAAASQGALILDNERIVVLTSYDELARRVATQTGNGGAPLRGSSIRPDLQTTNS
jgi:hypothetical protein